MKRCGADLHKWQGSNQRREAIMRGMAFLPKSCADCGATFQPTSGASKWCSGCRPIRSKKLEGDELAAALLAREDRRAANEHSEVQIMLVEARDQVRRQRLSTTTCQHRLDVLLAYPIEGKDSTVVRAVAEAAERRVEILEASSGHLERAESYLAAMELVAADELRST